MSKPNNPPAFPMTGEGYSSPKYSQYGMTLRDWFAGQALAGLSSATDATGLWQTDPVSASTRAYVYADAMLAERERNQ